MWKANSSLSKTTGLICRKYCRFKHNPSQRDIQAATVFVANTQNSIQGRMFTSVQCRILLSLRHSPCHCGIRALPQGPNEVFTHLLKKTAAAGTDKWQCLTRQHLLVWNEIPGTGNHPDQTQPFPGVCYRLLMTTGTQFPLKANDELFLLWWHNQ